MELVSGLKKAAPFVGMVVVESGEVVMTTLTKAAMNKGISNFVYVVYYNILATLILLPYFIFNSSRNKLRPLTFPLLWRFFLLGLLGKCLALFGYVGIDYSSPVLTAALGNLTPIFTFLIAIIFGMEKIDVRSSISQAKSLGTMIAVLGAFVVTLYKGPAIMLDNSPSGLSHQLLTPQQTQWILGGLLLAIGYLFAAAWSVLQAATVKEYPEKVTVVFFFVLFGTIQCAFVTLIVERNPSAWGLHHSIEIIAILYSAIFGTAIRFSIITWCLYAKGPLFVSLFKPLGMIIAEISGIIFLGDTLHLGSVIGAIIIALGFYSVMWGQSKEKSKIPEDNSRVESSTQNTPLLQNYSTEEA